MSPVFWFILLKLKQRRNKKALKEAQELEDPRICEIHDINRDEKNLVFICSFLLGSIVISYFLKDFFFFLNITSFLTFLIVVSINYFAYFILILIYFIILCYATNFVKIHILF